MLEVDAHQKKVAHVFVYILGTTTPVMSMMRSTHLLRTPSQGTYIQSSYLYMCQLPTAIYIRLVFMFKYAL